MTKRRVPTDRPPIEGLLDAWLTSLKERNFSEVSIRHHRYDGKLFLAFLAERGITHPREVTLAVLNRYRSHLFAWRSDNPRDNGKPLAWNTQYKRLLITKVFFRWLARERHILFDPAADLELPKQKQQLPRNIFTAEEMETLLAVPEVLLPLGLRDRAILEVMYSTGIRRTELTKVAVHDVDFTHGMLNIRFGKFGRERTVPIGERALAWLAKYLQEVRPRYVVDPKEDALFLSQQGTALTPKMMSVVVAKHMHAAFPDKHGIGSHTIRHTTATVMLRAGADIRHIQELLGHSDLKSTQVYTRVTPVNLKAVHDQFHPAAKLARKPVAEEDGR